MNIKGIKQTFTDRVLLGKQSGREAFVRPFAKSVAKSVTGSLIRPGYINYGSFIDQKNSLQARLKAEIDSAIKGGGS